MNQSTYRLTTCIQWAIFYIVGIITSLGIVTFSAHAHSFQTSGNNRAEPTASSVLGDEEIVEAIQKKAAVDGIETTDLQVFSANGIVTLDGSVPSLADKNYLRRIATGIRNVRGIVNQLSVKPSSLADHQVQSAAEEQLVTNTATDGYATSVSVNDGIVTLTGKVDSMAEKQLAAQVVSELRGVCGIKNEITVQYPDHRLDREIRAEILERLTNHVWIDEQVLTVEINSGVVRLQGKVATADLKDRLSMLVLTAGVLSVDDDEVQVDPSLSIAPKKRRPSTRLDFEIRNALVQSLSFDPRVDLRELELEVETGIVLLQGTVGDLQSKQAAVDTARNVAGVTNVIDKLVVQSESAVSDSTISTRLNDSFSRTATLKYDGITVQVNSGTVKLSGTVPSEYQRRRAASIAYSLAGVLEVNNQIAIDYPQGDRSDFDIGLDIERAMRWSPYLNITKLKYVVNDGVVTFTGTVANQQSLDLARAIAIDAEARDIISTDVAIE